MKDYIVAFEDLEETTYHSSHLRYEALTNVFPKLSRKWQRRIISLFEQKLTVEPRVETTTFAEGAIEGDRLHNRLLEVLDIITDDGNTASDNTLYYVFDKVYREMPPLWQQKLFSAMRRAEKVPWSEADTNISNQD